MKASPSIREEDLFGGSLFHHPVFLTEASARVVDLNSFEKDTSESLNAKRKVQNIYDLFCVMRKRTCRQDSEYYCMFPDLDKAEEDEDGDLLDEEYCCSGSDTYLSDSSEFDIISEHVLQDLDCMGESVTSKSMLISNSCCPNEDEETLVSKLSSETQKSILLLSPCEENGMMSKEDEVLSSASASPNGFQHIVDPQICYGHNNGMSLFRSDRDTSSATEVRLGDEISPFPVTKTLERPIRSWSVCDSIAEVRNIPLLEDSPGACNSLDEQLYVNLSSPENRDAEHAQAPLSLCEEEVDGEDEICFSDIDALIRKFNLVPDDSESYLNREELNMSKHPRHTILGLEHCARTSIRRAITSKGAIAVLHCRDLKHFIRKREVIIGRSSDGQNVDINLGKDGYGSKISRRQALVKLENNGSFSLKNLGREHILVNGEKLNAGQIVSLTSCSSVDIRGIVFVFTIIKEAVRQFLKNNQRRNSEDYTKFRWCE